ncbi:flagellar L-ring protein precursor FlgH [Litorimonas taeanensis]|uniref:Flagellar L-ring protein n=1 Tax=Litorimonas taeanensis TaxID=568099 RepID=A0A420WMA6_9PROT|nr:flagellar basal body L-ring protein FlgH [Litorimonas taeanensis]RKQ72154.1 flagellar L-ring protein precursor FlgH [Litorimonas taeanensis]
MNYLKTLTGLCCVISLSACATTKSQKTKAEFTQPIPSMSYAPNNYRLDSAPVNQTHSGMNAQETSLWNNSPKSLFGDRRASRTGDILTVLVEIDDEAELKNSITEDRQNSENLGIGAFFGLPEKLNGILPAGASTSPAVDLSRSRNLAGDGSIKREEKITLRLAVQVVDVLPNGYLQLAGKQQIMVNDEVRHLQVSGLIRTQDISRQNIITYDKIADARIYYGGKGQITDAIKPRAGNKIVQTIIPF